MVEGVGVRRVDRLTRIEPEIDELLDQHPERCAPVTDVVLADHPVADELEQAHQAVADDRAAQVADVHLLGHVRRRIVDYCRLGDLGGAYAEVAVGGGLDDLARQEGFGEGEVDEARPGHLDRTAHPYQRTGGHDLFGQFTRVAANLLGQGERTVGLGVGPVAGPHHWIDGGRFQTGDTGEGFAKRGSDGVQRIGHGFASVPFVPGAEPFLTPHGRYPGLRGRQ